MYDASPRVVMPVFSRGDMAEDTRQNLARRIHLMDDPLEKYSHKAGPLSFRRTSFIPASNYIRCTTDMLRNRRLGSIISYALRRTRDTTRTIFLRSPFSPSEVIGDKTRLGPPYVLVKWRAG